MPVIADTPKKTSGIPAIADRLMKTSKPVIADTLEKARSTITRVSSAKNQAGIVPIRAHMRYGFVSGKLAVRTAAAVDNDVIELMLETRDYTERAKLLADTMYGPYVIGMENLAQFEAGLNNAVIDAIDLLREAGMDDALEEYFHLDVTYLAGSEHTYFAEKLALAQKVGSAFLIQATRLEIDCANVRLLMRKRIAGTGADSLEANEAIIQGGTIDPSQLLSLYRDTETTRTPPPATDLYDPENDIPLEKTRQEIHDLATRLIALAPFRTIDPCSLEDVYTLDIALRGVQERFFKQTSRLSFGPEVLLAYVLRVKSETDLLRALAVGMNNNVDPRLLRRYLVVR
jgi:hypothetical protein